MAFIDASIPCFDFCASSTLAFIDDRFIIDPCGSEEEPDKATTEAAKNHGTVTVSSLVSIQQISQLVFKGFVEPSLLKEATRQLLEINKNHAAYLKKIASQKILRDLNES